MSIAERLLIARLRRRDEHAFSEIVARYGDRVFSLALRMIGNRAEAEDAAQEVFISVFKNIDTFRGEAKLSTWLLRIAANQCKNRLKGIARRKDGPGAFDRSPDLDVADGPGPVSGQAPRPDAILEAFELEALLQTAIAALDEEQRLVVLLRDVEELSYEEICEITGLAEGTVKSRLHRARHFLRAHLARHTR